MSLSSAFNRAPRPAREAFTRLTPPPRASEVIATFVGVLERIETGLTSPPCAANQGRFGSPSSAASGRGILKGLTEGLHR